MTRLPWLALLALLLPATVQAQQTRLNAARLTQATTEEREAFQAMETGKYTTARTRAEAILSDQPPGQKSWLATYVLSQVHFRHEGNHARALFLLREATQGLTRGRSGPMPSPEERRWHRRMMRDEVWVLSSMDRREEELVAIDRFEELYGPALESYRIWPLVKLSRFDEARAIGQKLLHSEDDFIREKAYNGLMAVEDEARNRKASFDWGMRANQATRGESCIISINLSLASWRAFKFEDAVRFGKQAIKTKDGSCSSPPEAQLTSIYLLAADFQKSLSALKSPKTFAVDANQRVQRQAYLRSRLVELLLALGQFEEAVERSEESIQHPDRAGTDSQSEEINRLAVLVLYHAVMKARLTQLEERAAIRPLWDSLKGSLKRRAVEASLWDDRRQSIRFAAHAELLKDLVRPYYSYTLPWYSAVLIDLIGPGLLTKVIEEARAAETDYPREAGAYLTGLQGEMAWRDGDDQQALALGQQALADLPKRAALYRWRISAWMARIYLDQGNTGAAKPILHELLYKWPTALRLMNIALPAVIEHDNTELGRAVADALAGSPRLAPDAGMGFTVKITTSGKEAVEICLRRGGFTYACTPTSPQRLAMEARMKHQQKADAPRVGPPPPPPEPPELEDPIEIVAVDRFHDRAFAPRLELTQSDLNTLDGRATRVGAEQAVSDLLGAGGR